MYHKIKLNSIYSFTQIKLPIFITHVAQLVKIWSNGVMELTDFSHYSITPIIHFCVR